MKLANTGLWVALVAAIGLTANLTAEPVTYYGYFSDIETTINGEVIFFWTADTLFGPLRSNDYIGLKYSPTFYDRVICRGFRYYQPQNIHFEVPPVLGGGPFRFVDSYPHLIDQADITIDSDSGRYLTIIRFRSLDETIVSQIPLNHVGNEEVVQFIEAEERHIIYVDGAVDVEGIVAGQVTIYASEDIGLRDDVRYLGSDSMGSFNSDSVTAILGLVSQKNMIIRNTTANGRGNGHGVARDDLNRHSIAINGSLIALNGSFTFDDQNEDWDPYQGPTPDFRGRIYLKGGIAQKRRGFIHRSNHGDTGYDKSYRYDSRLRTMAPPGLAVEDNPNISGDHLRIDLSAGEYTLSDVTVATMIIRPGTTLRLGIGNALTVSDTLLVEGTSDAPVRIIADAGWSVVEVRGGARALSLRHLRFSNGVEFVTDAESITASNVQFSDEVTHRGRAVFDSCEFRDEVRMTPVGSLSLTRSLLTKGLELEGNARECLVDHCTVIGDRGPAVSHRGRVTPVLSNSIIVGGSVGVASTQRDGIEIRYCDVFSYPMPSFDGCEAGEGTFSSDPLFAGADTSNYSLRDDSPCIDAGDPSTPRDPDGTRGDLGAFWLDRGVGIRSDDSVADPPRSAGLDVSPNPFNSTLLIRYDVGAQGLAPLQLAIYDLSGREVVRQVDGGSSVNPLRLTGRNSADRRGSAEETSSATWNASSVPAGVYLVRLQTGQEVSTKKVVLIR